MSQLPVKEGQRARGKGQREWLRPLCSPWMVGSTAAIVVLASLLAHWETEWRSRLDPVGIHPPLVMRGGDPYVRALMRTISASESNDVHPYSILYGGKHIKDLSHHPDLCITIVSGPNLGNCSTAAGRYQLLNTTWQEKAQRYHPHPSQMLFWQFYSFEPEFQDDVVYAWLTDSQAWGVDIPQLLRQKKLSEVLQRLSGTWTSLGYGIETNSMSGHLQSIYQKMLQEELRASR